jgi:hypothetical protein
MKLKDTTVNVIGLHSAFWQKLFIVDQYWRNFVGYELVITSANDGKHSTNSKHYRGLAIDMRTWKGRYDGNQLEGDDRAHLFAAVSTIMGEEFLVLSEGNHFHIQLESA